MWGAPYGDAAAKRRSAAPVASECVAGVPSLMVRAGGGLGRGVPACLVVASSPRRLVEVSSASVDTALLGAERGSFELLKTHLAPRPPRWSHRPATAGETGA